MLASLVLNVLVSYWPLVLISSVVTYLLRNKFRHGLNKYPGPPLAAYTDWWRFFDALGRKPEQTHIKLHRQYGDVVRMGPNIVSFADPRAIKIIYGLNKGFVKVILLNPLLSVNFISADTLLSLNSIQFSKALPRVAVSHPCSRLPMSISMHNIDDASTLHLQCQV